MSLGDTVEYLSVLHEAAHGLERLTRSGNY